MQSHSQPETSPTEMTEELLAKINQRWEDFYHRKGSLLRHYAWDDEDLVSIGLLSVRKTLEANPDCPDSWLVERARLDIYNARTPTARVHLSLDNQTDSGWVTDQLQYEAIDVLQRNPEIGIIDGILFRQMYEALGEMERKFLLILREEYIQDTRHRWWDGQYAHTQPQRPKPKKRFRTEVSWSLKDYYLSFANVRYQFYMHFGNEEEIAREKAWYASFSPNRRLHHKRDGRYDRD